MESRGPHAEAPQQQVASCASSGPTSEGAGKFCFPIHDLENDRVKLTPFIVRTCPSISCDQDCTDRSSAAICPCSRVLGRNSRPSRNLHLPPSRTILDVRRARRTHQPTLVPGPCRADRLRHPRQESDPLRLEHGHGHGTPLHLCGDLRIHQHRRSAPHHRDRRPRQPARLPRHISGTAKHLLVLLGLIRANKINKPQEHCTCRSCWPEQAPTRPTSVLRSH